MLSFLFILCFSSFLFRAAAWPVLFEKRGVASSQLAQFTLYEQYAAAAYCKDNNDEDNGSITCSAGNCQQVQQAGARSILEFQDLGETDATGFVAIDDTNRLIVLSYRGSSSLANWIGNINLGFASFSGCSGCQVHAGFLSSWQDSRDAVKTALALAKTDNPTYSIIATGHSLGAAISTIAVAELRQASFNIALYTYGSPMVGNNAFASFVTNQNGGNYRMTHAYDAVPKLPGYLIDYRHVSPEYWITAPTGQAVGTGDIKMSSGTFDLMGNQGTLMSTISDHLWYFNNISGCSSIDLSGF